MALVSASEWPIHVEYTEFGNLVELAGHHFVAVPIANEPVPDCFVRMDSR